MQTPGLPLSLGCSPQPTLSPEELSAGSPLSSGGQQRAVENELEGAGHQDRGLCGVRGLGGSGHWVCPAPGLWAISTGLAWNRQQGNGNCLQKAGGENASLNSVIGSWLQVTEIPLESREDSIFFLFSRRLAPSSNRNHSHQQLLSHGFPDSPSSFGSDWTRLRRGLLRSWLSLAHGAGGGVGAPSEDSHDHMSVWKKEIFPTKAFLFWRNRRVLSRHNKIHPSEPTVVCDTFPLAQRFPPSLKFMS